MWNLQLPWNSHCTEAVQSCWTRSHPEGARLCWMSGPGGLGVIAWRGGSRLDQNQGLGMSSKVNPFLTLPTQHPPPTPRYLESLTGLQGPQDLDHNPFLTSACPFPTAIHSTLPTWTMLFPAAWKSMASPWKLGQILTAWTAGCYQVTAPRVVRQEMLSQREIQAF